MTKHNNETHTLGQIINIMGDSNSQPWHDEMDIEIPGLADAIADGEADDFARASSIEAAYITEHENDAYDVMWPEHVISKRFDGDATFCPVN